jgi:hypothetical protein
MPLAAAYLPPCIQLFFRSKDCVYQCSIEAARASVDDLVISLHLMQNSRQASGDPRLSVGVGFAP